MAETALVGKHEIISRKIKVLKNQGIEGETGLVVGFDEG